MAAVRARLPSNARKPVPKLGSIPEESARATSNRVRVDKVALFEEAASLYRAAIVSQKKKEGMMGSIDLLRQSYNVFTELGPEAKAVRAATKVLSQLSFTYATLGLRSARNQDASAATRYFKEAKQLYHRIGDSAKEAMCCFQLGLLRSSGELAAIESLQEAIHLYGSIPGEELHEAMCLCELASIFVHKDPKSSIHWFKLALMLYCSRGNSDKEARTLFTIATLSCGLREYTVATAYFKQARVIFHRRENTMEDANCAYQLGKLATKAQQLTEAVTFFEEASNSYRRAMAPSEEGWCLYRLALVMVKCQSTSTAISYLSDARTLFQMSDDLEGQSSALLRLGELLRESDPPAARECLEEALLYTQLNAQSKAAAGGQTLDCRKTRRLTRDLAALGLGAQAHEDQTSLTPLPTSPSVATSAQSSPMLEHENSPMALSAKAWWSIPGAAP